MSKSNNVDIYPGKKVVSDPGWGWGGGDAGSQYPPSSGPYNAAEALAEQKQPTDGNIPLYTTIKLGGNLSREALTAQSVVDSGAVHSVPADWGGSSPAAHSNNSLLTAPPRERPAAQWADIKSLWEERQADPYRLMQTMAEFGFDAQDLAYATGQSMDALNLYLSRAGAPVGFAGADIIDRDAVDSAFLAALDAASQPLTSQGRVGMVDVQAFTASYAAQDTQASRDFARLHGTQFNGAHFNLSPAYAVAGRWAGGGDSGEWEWRAAQMVYTGPTQDSGSRIKAYLAYSQASESQLQTVNFTLGNALSQDLLTLSSTQTSAVGSPPASLMVQQPDMAAYPAPPNPFIYSGGGDGGDSFQTSAFNESNLLDPYTDWGWGGGDAGALYPTSSELYSAAEPVAEQAQPSESKISPYTTIKLGGTLSREDLATQLANPVVDTGAVHAVAAEWGGDNSPTSPAANSSNNTLLTEPAPSPTNAAGEVSTVDALVNSPLMQLADRGLTDKSLGTIKTGVNPVAILARIDPPPRPQERTGALWAAGPGAQSVGAIWNQYQADPYRLMQTMAEYGISAQELAQASGQSMDAINLYLSRAGAPVGFAGADIIDRDAVDSAFLAALLSFP